MSTSGAEMGPEPRYIITSLEHLPPSVRGEGSLEQNPAMECPRPRGLPQRSTGTSVSDFAGAMEAIDFNCPTSSRIGRDDSGSER